MSSVLRWLSPPRSISLALLVISFALGKLNTQDSQQLTPEERCGYRPGQFEHSVPSKDAIEITAWARAHGVRCWRAFMPFEAAKLVTDYKLVVHPQAWATGNDADADVILQAASTGTGPDIAFLGNENVIGAYKLGYIEPLDVCLDRYPEFDDIREDPILWSPLTWNDLRLGVPIEPAVEGFFFNKSKLRQLGWSENDIDQLPEQIRSGHFTLQDVVNIARQAVETGVVRPGLGYWPNFRRNTVLMMLYHAFGGDVQETQDGQLFLSRRVLERVYAFQRQLFVERISYSGFAGQEVGALYMNRNLYHDIVAHGEVLFWNRNLTEWSAEYAFNYTGDLGGEAYISKTIGYALFPSGLRGRPASTRLSNIEAYVILSERATGRQNQDAACAVLAKVMTPEIHSLFATSAGTLGVLKSQDNHPAFVTDRFARETRYFWDYMWRWPQDNPNSDQYLSVLDKYLAEVETGRLAPEQAVEAAVRELQAQLPNSVIIVP